MAVGKTVQGITIRDENPQGTRCCEIMWWTKI